MNGAEVCDGCEEWQDGLDRGRQEVGEAGPQASVDEDEGDHHSAKEQDEESIGL